jgi:hypothetical protein
MIEYIPGRYAHRPGDADGYLFIHCLFVGFRKEFKGHGHASSLILDFSGEVVAPAICFELSMQEHHDYAPKQGAIVYLASTLNSVTGVETDLARMEAFATRYHIPTLMNNYVGESGGYQGGGK